MRPLSGGDCASFVLIGVEPQVRNLTPPRHAEGKVTLYKSAVSP